MKIIDVNPESPLFGKVRPGDSLVSVNDQPVTDNIDCMFKLADEVMILDVEDKKGRHQKYRVDYPDEPGLTFEPDKIKRCRNNCIFCFVHQQPKGMRRSLYVKDDDYRLSFTHGNFISFSNITDDDMNRIIEQRLSPLYVSVHSTDDDLRMKLFANKKLLPIMPRLKKLTENGIRFHTQVVVCPGINDGVHLDKTITELQSLYPGVETLGIVPVGLTRYRDNLPKLKSFTPSGANHILKYIHKIQKKFLKSCGTRFVFAADEFYILAGRSLPALYDYEQMEQFENGIGMMRYFLTDFNRRRRFIRVGAKPLRIAIITGETAYKIFDKDIMPYLKIKSGLKADLFPVKNRFWGEKVAVTGLLTGQDILSEIKKINKQYDIALLPPNCLNNDGLFLDDMSLEDFKLRAGMDIVVGSYSLVDTLNRALL